MKKNVARALVLPGSAPEYGVRALNADEAEIVIYDVIGYDWWTGGGVTAKQFRQDLAKVTAKTIHLRINSPGGDVFDGFAIYEALKEKDAHIIAHIDGLAASAASYIALAAKEVRMGETSFFMIHNAWSWVAGDKNQMRKTAELLDKLDGTIVDIYAKKTGEERAEISAKMDAETWFSAEEALEFGLADSIKTDEKAAAKALFDPSVFRNAPAPLKRAAENALRDAGHSRQEAKRALSEPDLNRLRDAGGERSQRDAELLDEIQNAIRQGTAILSA